VNDVLNGNEEEEDEYYEDNIFNYDVTKEQVKEFFRFLFAKNNRIFY
jgi:hypothetical protein